MGHVGARLLADLADATGLTAAYSTALRPLRPRGTGHAPGRIAADLAVMLADGGQTIAELAVLRGQSEVFGPVASTPTAWPLLATVLLLRRLEAVLDVSAPVVTGSTGLKGAVAELLLVPFGESRLSGCHLGRLSGRIARGFPLPDHEGISQSVTSTSGGCEGDGCLVGLGSLLVAGGDASPLLEAVEAPFHHVAALVDLLVEGRRSATSAAVPDPVANLIRPLRDGVGDAAASKPGADRLRAVALVADDVVGPDAWPTRTGTGRPYRRYRRGEPRSRQ